QVVAEPGGLPVIDIESQPVQLRPYGLDGDRLTVRVITHQPGHGTGQHLGPAGEPQRSWPDVRDRVELREPAGLELVEEGHSLAADVRPEFAQFLEVAVLDLLELLSGLRYPFDALGALPLDLVRERLLRDPHSVCPHRRRWPSGRL